MRTRRLLEALSRRTDSSALKLRLIYLQVGAGNTTENTQKFTGYEHNIDKYRHLSLDQYMLVKDVTEMYEQI